MAKNMFGTRLDRNGYAPSVMETEEGVCWLCGEARHTERHEVFGGALRAKAKALGLWVDLCAECHREGKESVQNSGAAAAQLKGAVQREAMAAFDWGVADWRREFYKNYLLEDEECA